MKNLFVKEKHEEHIPIPTKKTKKTTKTKTHKIIDGNLLKG